MSPLGIGISLLVVPAHQAEGDGTAHDGAEAEQGPRYPEVAAIPQVFDMPRQYRPH
jgi:hypothetical protein